MRAALAGGGAKAAPAAAAARRPPRRRRPGRRRRPAALAPGPPPTRSRLFEPGSYEEVPLDGMRKTIAKRLVESKQTVPHFYLTVDCELDALMALREQINGAAAKDKDGKPAFKLSVNDFVIKALAVALLRVPAANAVWAEDRILKLQARRRRRRGGDRGRAVHAGDPQGRAEDALRPSPPR